MPWWSTARSICSTSATASSVSSRLAVRAGVGEVVLTHLSPGLDDEHDLGGYTRGISPTFKGRVVVAGDLDRF